MIIRLSLAILCLLYTSLSIFAQVNIPALSPSISSVEIIGLAEISFDYSRPSIKDRKIFGNDGVVPFGKMWRTGANAPTKITFSQDVYVGKTLLRKGVYTIISIPEESIWTIHWYTHKGGSWNSYIEENPIHTIEVRTVKNCHSEMLRIGLNNIDQENGIIEIVWEDTGVHIPISVDTHDIIMKNIDRVIAGTSNNEYFQSAMYLHESNTDLERALTYIREVTKSEKALFFHHHREALILKDLGRNQEAIQAAIISKEQAKAAKNDDFVRLNEVLIQSLK